MDYIKNKRCKTICKYQKKIAKLKSHIDDIKDAQIKDDMETMTRPEVVVLIRSFIFPFLKTTMGKGKRYKDKNIEIKKQKIYIYNDKYKIQLYYEEVYPNDL